MEVYRGDSPLMSRKLRKSSSNALLIENGPCHVNEDGVTTTLNPFRYVVLIGGSRVHRLTIPIAGTTSATVRRAAHESSRKWSLKGTILIVLYIDQPIGTGFSHGTVTVNSTFTAAPAFWQAFQVLKESGQFDKYKSKE